MLVVAVLAGCATPPAQSLPGVDAALPLRHAVRDGVVEARVGRVDKLKIDSTYRYLGGQRFILQNTADAEQHVFADVDSAGLIRRMYWIQFEEMLPDRSGTYDYSPDSLMTVAGLPLRVNVGLHGTSPQRNSDRAAVYRLLERAGFTPPLPATRVRLIYLPDEKKRAELMVIYIERHDTAEPSAADLAGSIERATSGGLQFLTRG